MASPGERLVAEVVGFLKHQHVHLKVGAAAFSFFSPEGCASVLCFLGLRCICSDKVLHLGLLVAQGPWLLIESALASATQDKQDPHGEEDHSKHQSPDPQGLVIIMKRVLFFLLLSCWRNKQAWARARQLCILAPKYLASQASLLSGPVKQGKVGLPARADLGAEGQCGSEPRPCPGGV